MAEQKSSLERILKMTKYIKIMNDHGIFTDPQGFMDDLSRIVDTLPIVLDYVGKIDMHSEISEAAKDTAYDSMKFMANLCLFKDAVIPIADKYNPSDDKKNEFIEFMKKDPNWQDAIKKTLEESEDK